MEQNPIMGKRVELQIPLNATEAKTVRGTVVDKFKNSFVDDSRNVKPDDARALVVTYDNYMVVTDDNEAMACHPTLITKIFMNGEPDENPSEKKKG